jgi:uncharacterized membrane protein
MSHGRDRSRTARRVSQVLVSLLYRVPAVHFTEIMEHVAQGFEWLGALVLALGSLYSFVLAGITWYQSGNGRYAYTLARQLLGGTLLLGLEILVAADLVRTIAVDLTLENVLTLGLIVLIRTFLSFSLEIEIAGTPPWRRGPATGIDMISQARQGAQQLRQRPEPPKTDSASSS